MMRRQSVIYLKDACASIGFWVQGHLVVTSLPVAVIMPGGYGCPCFMYFAGFRSGTVYSILAAVTLLHWALVNTWSRPSAAGKPQRSPHGWVHGVSAECFARVQHNDIALCFTPAAHRLRPDAAPDPARRTVYSAGSPTGSPACR